MLLSIAEIWVFKNHFCIHVNGDVNFDKLVHENMFYSVITGFPKSGHIFWHKNGHNQAKIVAMPKGIMGGFFGIIRSSLSRAVTSSGSSLSDSIWYVMHSTLDSCGGSGRATPSLQPPCQAPSLS